MIHEKPGARPPDRGHANAAQGRSPRGAHVVHVEMSSPSNTVNRLSVQGLVAVIDRWSIVHAIGSPGAARAALLSGAAL